MPTLSNVVDGGEVVGRGVDVLHVVPSYHPARSGIEVLVENLVTELRVGRGVVSAVVAPALPSQRPADYVHRGTRVHSIPVPQAIMNIYEATTPIAVSVETSLGILADIYASLRSIFTSTQPSVVHIHSVSMMAPAAAALAASQDIPVLFHEHSLADVNPVRYKQQLRTARWVCAVSQAVADSVRDECCRMTPVHVIPNGLEDPLNTIGYQDECVPSVAMVGRLAHEKGFDDGLEALNIVRRRFPDLRIRLVGDGPCGAQLHEQARRLDLLNQVDYYGRLDHEEALSVVAGSSLVLIPSRCTEGFSLVAAEAALLERSVVATTIGGLPETVLDEQTGLLVPPGDVSRMAAAVERLLNSPALRSAMGKSARDRAVEFFSVRRFAADIARLYEQMLGGPDAPASGAPGATCGSSL